MRMCLLFLDYVLVFCRPRHVWTRSAMDQVWTMQLCHGVAQSVILLQHRVAKTVASPWHATCWMWISVPVTTLWLAGMYLKDTPLVICMLSYKVPMRNGNSQKTYQLLCWWITMKFRCSGRAVQAMEQGPLLCPHITNVHWGCSKGVPGFHDICGWAPSLVGVTSTAPKHGHICRQYKQTWDVRHWNWSKVYPWDGVASTWLPSSTTFRKTTALVTVSRKRKAKICLSIPATLIPS